MHKGKWFIGKVLLPTHAAESVEQVLYCLTEFNLTAVHTITIKMVTTISVVYTQQSCNHSGSFIPIQQKGEFHFHVDNFDANAISPQEVTMLFESMNAVAW
jgi:hypothetical protein